MIPSSRPAWATLITHLSFLVASILPPEFEKYTNSACDESAPVWQEQLLLQCPNTTFQVSTGQQHRQVLL